ncbi:hypothetical protein T4B_7381 [Trichinella pseudospiralis]|uniref:Uncharacterized protein n=1 Tax=Trichinella pseudospiralis TaxID=6337 RepID=A0A0V1EWF2_TRIPS|nr:hypothetical protein T4A_3446 [Trichinella pseudospiralis]KRZ25696.1 hypothetical protein T4B_7381 [Trichinella pseudospiralis]KRZ44489.1 hypothetical protein T4C_3884 [Trichinella pseudospiralis]
MDSSIDCFSSVFADLHAARNSYNTGRILNHRSFGAAFTQIHKIQPAFIDALLFLTKSGHCPFPQFLTGCLRCGMSLEHFDKIFVFFD